VAFPVSYPVGAGPGKQDKDKGMISRAVGGAYAALVFDFDGTLAELTIDFDQLRNKIAALAECFLEERPAPDGQPVLEWLGALSRRAEARSGPHPG
jgi:phosphoglycolate phosphatase